MEKNGENGALGGVLARWGGGGRGLALGWGALTRRALSGGAPTWRFGRQWEEVGETWGNLGKKWRKWRVGGVLARLGAESIEMGCGFGFGVPKNPPGVARGASVLTGASVLATWCHRRIRVPAVVLSFCVHM